MPRFSNTGGHVGDWCDREETGSSTRDLCRRCGATAEGTPWPATACDPSEPGEPVGVHCPGDVEHPPYADEDYRCDACGCRLTARDD